jgi:hypothetical protein
MMIPQVQVHIVIARYHEDLSWVALLPYPFTLIDRSAIPPEEPPNRGCEASVYLEYILSNYENLVEYTLFLHGHRTAWHHPTPIDERISKIIFKGLYLNISETKMALYPHCKDLMPGASWLQWLEEEILGRKIDFQRYRFRPGAIFYVHRDAIRRYPVAMYQRLYDEMMSSSDTSREMSRRFEYSWHMLFLQDETDHDPKEEDLL